MSSEEVKSKVQRRRPCCAWCGGLGHRYKSPRHCCNRLAEVLVLRYLTSEQRLASGDLPSADLSSFISSAHEIYSCVDIDAWITDIARRPAKDGNGACTADGNSPIWFSDLQSWQTVDDPKPGQLFVSIARLASRTRLFDLYLYHRTMNRAVFIEITRTLFCVCYAFCCSGGAIGINDILEPSVMSFGREYILPMFDIPVLAADKLMYSSSSAGQSIPNDGSKLGEALLSIREVATRFLESIASGVCGSENPSVETFRANLLQRDAAMNHKDGARAKNMSLLSSSSSSLQNSSTHSATKTTTTTGGGGVPDRKRVKIDPPHSQAQQSRTADVVGAVVPMDFASHPLSVSAQQQQPPSDHNWPLFTLGVPEKIYPHVCHFLQSAMLAYPPDSTTTTSTTHVSHPIPSTPTRTIVVDNFHSDGPRGDGAEGKKIASSTSIGKADSSSTSSSTGSSADESSNSGKVGNLENALKSTDLRLEDEIFVAISVRKRFYLPLLEYVMSLMKNSSS